MKHRMTLNVIHIQEREGKGDFFFFLQVINLMHISFIL